MLVFFLKEFQSAFWQEREQTSWLVTLDHSSYLMRILPTDRLLDYISKYILTLIRVALNKVVNPAFSKRKMGRRSRVVIWQTIESIMI